jgi:hypothetical protein
VVASTSCALPGWSSARALAVTPSTRPKAATVAKTFFISYLLFFVLVDVYHLFPNLQPQLQLYRLFVLTTCSECKPAAAEGEPVPPSDKDTVSNNFFGCLSSFFSFLSPLPVHFVQPIQYHKEE